MRIDEGFLRQAIELAQRALEKVEVAGPLLFEESIKVHEGYWSKPPAVL